VTVGLALTANAKSRAQLVAAAAVFGLGFGNQYPAFVGHVMKFVDPKRRGAAFGGILAAFDTGVGTGSIGVGSLAEHFGFGAAFGIAAGLSAFSIPYFVWAEKRYLLRGAALAASPDEPGELKRSLNDAPLAGVKSSDFASESDAVVALEAKRTRAKARSTDSDPTFL
jgi:MFS family permease